MKKAVAATVLFIAILISPRYLYPVYAQDSATTSVPRTTRTALKERIQNTKVRVASAEARMADRKENIASRATALRTKLAAFKNQRKAKLAEKINDTLSKINTRRTEQMVQHLQKMSELLTKVEERTAGATGDKTNLNKSLTAAKAAISSAQTAVQAQSIKTYTIIVNTEQTVKADSKDARDMLHTDLKTSHDLVITARQAVAKAITDAITLKGEQTNGQ